MRQKPISEIGPEDIRELVANSVPESRVLEFKRDLHQPTDAGKKELLADISAFANTLGGDLIFGVEEGPGGVAVDCPGIEIRDADATIRWIESLVQTGIAPRLQGVEIRTIRVDNKTCALVVRVARSFNSPHMVTLGNHAKFYGRNSAGKYQLDVDQLRNEFVSTSTRIEKIRGFRVDRIMKLLAGDTPAPMERGPKLVLHLVPLGTFDAQSVASVPELRAATGSIRPPGASGWNSRINLDGSLMFAQGGGQCAYSYVQVWRRGILEIVVSHWLEPHPSLPDLMATGYEIEIWHEIPRYREALQRLRVSGPVAVFLSMLGVRGRTVLTTERRSLRTPAVIDRDDLIIPEVVVEDITELSGPSVVPLFDQVWNASGLDRSTHFDEEGNPIER